MLESRGIDLEGFVCMKSSRTSTGCGTLVAVDVQELAYVMSFEGVEMTEDSRRPRAASLVFEYHKNCLRNKRK